MLVLLGAGLQPNEGHYRLALESEGYRVAGRDPAEQHPDGTVVGLVNAENADAQLNEWRRQFARVRPVLIGDAMSFSDSADMALATAPTLPANAATEVLLRIMALLSRGGGWLLAELVHLDRNAKQLAGDEFCEWVRSRPGIIGIVQAARFAPIQQLTSNLRRLIQHAYSLLDRLPREKLSVQDIWNVTLLIAVPIKELDLGRDSDIARSLHSISRDVTGSRKVVLWLDRRVADYFGPLGEGRQLWKLSSDDPLRGTLERLATDSVEREALEMVFKRRLSQENIEELLRVLSRHK
jgi:hypothetical protein